MLNWRFLNEAPARHREALWRGRLTGVLERVPAVGLPASSLGRLHQRLQTAGRAVQDPNSLGKGHKFRQRLDLHFLHDPVTMGLNRTFGPPQRAGDLLVGLAANDKFKDLPLARRQCCDMSANDVQPALQDTSRFVTCEGPFNCAKKVVRCDGFGQKIICTRFNGSHCGGDIGMAGEEYDRQCRAEFA